MTPELFYRKRLEDNLKNYASVFLVSSEYMKLFSKYFNRLPEDIFDHIMIMTTEMEYTRMTSIKLVSQYEYNVLKLLYLTYEFSDRFYLIEKANKYGTIENYIEAGIITPIEAVRTILQ